MVTRRNLRNLFALWLHRERFLSEGYAAVKPAVLRLDLRHEESARTLGATPGKVFKRITLPLARYVGSVLSSLYCHCQRTPNHAYAHTLGRQTLAFRIFDAQQEDLWPTSAWEAFYSWGSPLLFKASFIAGDDMSESIPLNIQNLSHSYESTPTFSALTLTGAR